MSAAQFYQNSGSDKDPRLVVDQRKKKRMLSNRESARRSRMKKQKHLDELLNQVGQLITENDQILDMVNISSQNYVNMESENTVLRVQLMELTDRLTSLNSVLHIVEEISGLAMDIPEIPDPLMKPWQLPYPAQPIMASANMLQY